jgi:hypothetical protein
MLEGVKSDDTPNKKRVAKDLSSREDCSDQEIDEVIVLMTTPNDTKKKAERRVGAKRKALNTKPKLKGKKCVKAQSHKVFREGTRASPRKGKKVAKDLSS